MRDSLENRFTNVGVLEFIAELVAARSAAPTFNSLTFNSLIFIIVRDGFVVMSGS